MGGFSTQGMTSQQNPQQAAANGVKATAGSSPSLGQMQQGMGGLLGNETQQGAFDNFFGGLKETFMPFFGGLMDRGEETLGNDPTTPTTPNKPELSPYEARIQELMTNRGMSREQAVANQAGAAGQGGDINNNGAITNDEWARKLGSDFDNDGNVTNEEFAQWKQQNPDHRAAGGTKYSGLPGQNGLFAGQVSPWMPETAEEAYNTLPQRHQQQPQAAAVQPAAATTNKKTDNLFELPEKTQKAIENFKKLGGLFR